MFNLITRWYREEDATALMETIVLFPVMLTLLMGCFDLGQAIAVNQKTLAAAQIMADLVARNEDITLNTVEDIITAGELSFAPYAIGSFGYDIVSIKLVEDVAPEVLWRVTENMDPNQTAVENSDDLGGVGGGLVVVTANYNYVPFFTKFWLGDFNMSEVAFFRPRRSATVLCNDCPN